MRKYFRDLRKPSDVKNSRLRLTEYESFSMVVYALYTT